MYFAEYPQLSPVRLTAITRSALRHVHLHVPDSQTPSLAHPPALKPVPVTQDSTSMAQAAWAWNNAAVTLTDILSR